MIHMVDQSLSAFSDAVMLASTFFDMKLSHSAPTRFIVPALVLGDAAVTSLVTRSSNERLFI